MSRLQTSAETAKLRESLVAKNLYSPDNIYEIDNPAIVDAVNAIANIALPFKSFDLTNTVIGRIVGPNTPIAQIGLIQLGKQFAQTVVSQGSAEIIPTFSLKNLFDKNPNTKFALKKIDYRITRDETQSNIGRILETLTGTNLRPSPITPTSTDADYIRNTGKGQLALLSDTLGRNYYRSSSNAIYGTLEREGFPMLSKYAKSEGYFSEDAPYKVDSDIEYGFTVSQLRRSLSKNNSPYQEYGSSVDKKFSTNKEFIDALGRTDNNFISTEEDLFGKTTNGTFEDINNQIIWGKSGVSDETLQLQAKTRGQDDEGNDINIQSQDIVNKFNSRSGLLKYTSDLLNAYGGNIIDQTRKKIFKKTDLQKSKGSFVGYNGSGLYVAPDTALPAFRGKEGLRQHTVIDQYDRFAKAIRFDGNYVYNGNPNSVVYERVIPNITPTRSKSSDAINKKVMFSLENLAFQLNEEGQIMGLPEGMPNIQLPKCEVGQNYGRLMWFAPYDINLEEQATAKWEAVNFIGRNEPMYTYGFSERTATLSFKLIIDYPPQVKGFTSHKQFADFFAFGGQGVKNETNNLSDKEKRLNEITVQLQELSEKTVVNDKKEPNYGKFNFYFPNDVPRTTDNLETIVDTILTNGYQDGDEGNDPGGQNDYGYNKGFAETISGISKSIADNNEVEYLRIEYVGNASKLYANRSKEFDYNKALGDRRAIAIYNYFSKSLKKALKTTKELEELGVSTNLISLSSTLAPESTRPASSVNSQDSVLARFATVDIKPNGKPSSGTDPNQQVNPNQEQINLLIEEKDALEKSIAEIKAEQQSMSNCIFEPFTIADGQAKGFDYIRQNKFVPVYYSQTPEDFHKRLTFLQQCVRQGSAMRLKNNGDDLSSKNSVFGRQPVCILRLGDFFYTKVIIDSINFSYSDAPWDMNPEGMGMQFMICDVSMSMKVIGGQSMRGPIDVLQNAIGFNYYANSTYYSDGIYALPKAYENLQYGTDDPKNTEKK